MARFKGHWICETTPSNQQEHLHKSSKDASWIQTNWVSISKGTFGLLFLWSF